MSITRIQILRLYKDIARYSEELKYTDKDYFLRRVRKEFKKNRELENEKEISFNYKVNHL